MSQQNEDKDQQQAQKAHLDDLERKDPQELTEQDAENVRGGMVSGKLTSGDKI